MGVLFSAPLLLTVFAAAILGGALSSAPHAADARGIVFMGGPLLLFAGLHARLTDYLHNKNRLRTLPLPLPPRHHLRAGWSRHLREFALATVVGLLAIAAGATAAGHPLWRTAGLLADFAWLCTFALIFEVYVAATCSDLGRRLPEDSALRSTQAAMSGGLTAPETAIYLWAPALGLAAATACAMPGQLSFDRAMDGLPVADRLWGLSFAPLVLALFARLRAPGVYARGFFQAVPWLHEVSKTLAGPPVPRRAPAFIYSLPPALRLWVLRLWRSTPLMSGRLLGVVLATAIVATGELSTARVAAGAALGLLWLSPCLAALSPANRRAGLGALPVSAPGWSAAALALSPLAISILVISLVQVAS